MSTSKQIFLSHSGLDATLAKALAACLRAELGVDVFSTSDPEYRFAEGAPGCSTDYDKELLDYLTTQLTSSSAYFLLITPRSLKANSPWIAKEIAAATLAASLDPGVKVIPCAANGLSTRELPEVVKDIQCAVLEDKRVTFAYASPQSP